MPASTGKKAPHKSDSLRRTDLLFEAASALLSSPRLDEVLQRILKFAAMAIQADAYAVWRYNKSSDAWGAIASEGLSPAYLQRSTIPSGKAAVFPDRPIVAPDVSRSPMLKQRKQDYAKENIKSLLVMPLKIHGEKAGTITFYFRSQRAFGEQEIKTAEVLATLAAAAVGNAELYEEQLKLREEAEAQTRRSGFLANASTILGSSLDFHTTLQEVAQLAVPMISDWCAAYVLEESGMIRRTAVAHKDPAKLALANELYAKYPPALERGSAIAQCVADRKTMHIADITDEMVVKGARDAYHLQLTRQLNIAALLLVPMISRDRVVGVLIFVMAESRRKFTSSDIEMANALASRAASAIENALLYAAAQREVDVRTRAERELRVSQERLRLVQRSAQIGSWEMDLETEHVICSPEFVEILGLDSNITSLNYKDFLSRMYFSSDRERAGQALKKATRSSHDKEYEVQFRINHPSAGERLLASRGRVFYNEGKPVLIAVLVDITLRKANHA